MTASLPSPGVSVLQSIRKTSPTVLRPVLSACVVGVCKQVVPVLLSSGTSNTLNPDAKTALPAQFLADAAPGPDYKYSGLGGLDLVFSPNNGADVVVTFPTSPADLTPSTVVSTVNKALAAAGVSSFIAETVGTTQWRLRSLAVGEYQSLDFSSSTDPTVASAFGIVPSYHYEGATAYTQREYTVPPTNIPDPRGIMAELSVEFDTIRAFLALGSGSDLRELSRTESFLRNGGGEGSAASLTGTVDLGSITYGAGGPLENTTTNIQIGSTVYSVTFGANAPADSAALLTAINGQIGAVATATNTGYLHIETLDTTADAKIVLVSGTGPVNPLTTLGFTAGQTAKGTDPVFARADASGSTQTSLIEFVGEDFTASATAAAMVGSTNIAGLSYPNPVGIINHTLELEVAGGAPQTLTFPGTLTNSAAVLNAINNFFPGITATLNVSNHLVLTSTKLGDEATIKVVGGTALTALGLTAGTVVRGSPFPPKPGDRLYVDGVLFGTITQVAPGGVVNVLKISKKVPVSNSVGQLWFMEAVALDGEQTATRPSSDLIVDLHGNVRLKADVLRDIHGVPLVGAAARADVYVSYKAVRKDVTARAKNPSLWSFDDVTQVQDLVEPIDTTNPFALGLYMALINAPGNQVFGLGVDEISADAPYGTSEAYARAAEYLEAHDVYAISLLTHDVTSAQIFQAHVDQMSLPDQRRERVLLFNPAVPTHKVDAIVASGLGNSGPDHALTFDTGVVNLGALLLSKGIDPSGTIPVEDGVFLDIAANDKHYSIESVTGSVVTIRTSFGAGENDDGFYSTTDLNDPPLTSTLIDQRYSVLVRGAPLTQGGVLDRDALVDTYVAMGQGFSDHRVWHMVAESLIATIAGLDQTIEGFYATAAYAGLVSAQPPQQSFTSYPVVGIKRVIGTQDTFRPKQLDQIAGGGNWILHQATSSSPVTARMALTSDVSSIETRTDSITKILDFVAIFLRQSLRAFIGRFNITQGLLDSFGTVLQGLCGYLVEVGVLLGFDVNQIIQDEANPDSVLIDITLDVPYPCNYINLTLAI